MDNSLLCELTLNETTGFDRTGDAIVSGVPLGRGMVREADRLVLRDAVGKRLTMQAESLAVWPDGSVKWALLTVPRFGIGGGAKAGLCLELGRPSRLQPRVRLRTVKRGLRVDNGRVRFTIARRGRLVPILESRVGGRWHRRAVDLDLHTAVQHAEGRPPTSYHARRAGRQIEIESVGPLRAVIAVRGRHRSAEGETFGPYTLRFEVLAGSNQVRLTHSVVYDGDPEKDFVRASEVTLRAVVGDGGQRFGFGGDDGREVRFERQRADFAPDFRYAELYQDSCSHWRVRRWVALDRREVFCEEGLHADGWMELLGQQGRLAVAVRDFWQNHPKSLWGDAKTGCIGVGLYPARADRLDLRRYSRWVHPYTYESPAFRQEAPFRFDEAFGAHGIRKTHELVLMFDEPNASGAALRINRPLRLTWPAKHTARSQAVVPAAVRTDGSWLGRVDELLDFLNLAMRRDGGTGYLDYFDLPHGFDTRSGRWHHDFGGFGYINNEAMPCLGLWQAYLLTGREDAFDMARAMTRHNADIDSYHLGPNAGLGSRHNINHWGCRDKEPRISQPAGKRFAYYLTGDRSVLDLVRVMMDYWRRSPAVARPLGMTAYVPALISTLMVAQETHVADVEGWLVNLADAVAASVDEHGQMNWRLIVDPIGETAEPYTPHRTLSFTMFSSFGGPQTLAELAERYEHQALRDAMVRMARYALLGPERRDGLDRDRKSPVSPDQYDTALRAVDLWGYAYQATKDPAFAVAARRLGRWLCVRIENRPTSRYGVDGAGRKVMPVGHTWREKPNRLAETLRTHYPLFYNPRNPCENATQHFLIALYLHKMQGLVLLAEADGKRRPKRSAGRGEP